MLWRPRSKSLAGSTARQQEQKQEQEQEQKQTQSRSTLRRGDQSTASVVRIDGHETMRAAGGSRWCCVGRRRRTAVGTMLSTISAPRWPWDGVGKTETWISGGGSGTREASIDGRYGM